MSDGCQMTSAVNNQQPMMKEVKGKPLTNGRGRGVCYGNWSGDASTSKFKWDMYTDQFVDDNVSKV